jgi:ABC-type multidrug transport system fused ATPase/permease subunit
VAQNKTALDASYIVERVNRLQLLTLNGVYARMWSLQQSGED